ncbi:Aquaporin family protein [Rhodovastum atsumiense]|uniref:Aquaporin family protein n=1 Tax=Rhodovastum atsumiense TaxID=504468 RepID=A0A5M6J3B1_9PROT|nr:aquaporin [Rhodovastum atsumiense]KAA5614145.1 aquaporin family protein [Rhodovastum atsumiense]CAH2598998.1 Aquaporin family protein [Rhodovastum atsumiense]
MRAALRSHWPEYLMEAAGLGTIMLVTATVVTAVEALVPAFGVLPAVARRAMEGSVVTATVVALIYSPWGRQSGAHFNPAVTLTFLWLGRVRPWDAIFYAMAQIAGGIAGLLLAFLLLGTIVSVPPVTWIITVPGANGTAIAFVTELLCAFLLMVVVLTVGGMPSFARLTGLAVGGVVFLCVLLAAPLSGFSINPARSLASALPAGVWTAFWVYLLAPPLGMLAAALANRHAHLPQMRCAKLIHDETVRCIHCGFRPMQRHALPSVPSAGRS